MAPVWRHEMCGACAVTKVIRNNLDLWHIHVKTLQMKPEYWHQIWLGELLNILTEPACKVDIPRSIELSILTRNVWNSGLQKTSLFLSCCGMEMPLDNTNDGHFKLHASVNVQNILWTGIVKIVRCVPVFWCHYWHLKARLLSHVLQWLVFSADFPQLLPLQLSKIALKLGLQILGARSDAWLL
jgi:hypothetical protein